MVQRETVPKALLADYFLPYSQKSAADKLHNGSLTSKS